MLGGGVFRDTRVFYERTTVVDNKRVLRRLGGRRRLLFIFVLVFLEGFLSMLFN